MGFARLDFEELNRKRLYNVVYQGIWIVHFNSGHTVYHILWFLLWLFFFVFFCDH